MFHSEPDKSAQEEDPEGKPDQMGSSASLPAEQSKFDAVIDPTIERVKGSPIPRSVAGSRQSIKSRKGEHQQLSAGGYFDIIAFIFIGDFLSLFSFICSCSVVCHLLVSYELHELD